MFTCTDGDYSCTIEFVTIKHVKLEAKSGYNNSSPEEAVSKAINKAKEIVRSMKDEIAKYD